MCQSQAEGGRRCAAHTRPAYSKAVDEVLSADSFAGLKRARELGRAAVVAHALTPTGRVEIEAEMERVYRTRGRYLQGCSSAGWLAQCAYEADEENARSHLSGLPDRDAWNDGNMTDDLLTGTTLEHLERAEVTYPEVGSTRGDLPPGYQHLQRNVCIEGLGQERFEEAANTLLGWNMHRRAGVSVRASTDRVTDGAVAVLRLGWGALGVDAPVRVIYTVDEERRKGFAYGTLPGHPERGEESFMLELHDSGQVTFTIHAFSCPASLLARVGGPVSRTVQSWVTDRYLRAL